jgi:D-alanine-D-alanine ligase
LKVAVLMGGDSPEREVSLRSGANAAEALREAGYEVIAIDVLNQDLAEIFKVHKVEVAFIALHGAGGEDGVMQGYLERLGIPYTGSGVLASALSMDKIISKKVFVASGIPTPAWLGFKKEVYKDQLKISEVEKLGFPLMVKPSTAGSTVGVRKIFEVGALYPAIEAALQYSNGFLLEKFIAGKEITVGVFGAEPYPTEVIEIKPRGEFYTYETKYVPGMSIHPIPADLPPELYRQAQEWAVTAHKALDCYALSRVDMMVSEAGQIYVLEVNTIPGMTGTSLVPEVARYMGISFPQFVDMQIKWALARSEK